jgi:hypothetical protein
MSRGRKAPCRPQAPRPFSWWQSRRHYRCPPPPVPVPLGRRNTRDVLTEHKRPIPAEPPLPEVFALLRGRGRNRIVVERGPVCSGEGGHDVLPPPREWGQRRLIIALVVITIIAATPPPVRPPPPTSFPCTGTHPRTAPVTASPIPITAFLLACTLPLVLQGKQSQQLHATPPAHQPCKGSLPPPPPPPISPPSHSFFPVCLLAGVVVLAVSAAMEMGGRRPWRGHLLWGEGAVGMRTWVLIPLCIHIVPM